ncbi:MAG: esterase-like activity of phytase family protein [Alphaproteobacteria bacterium]|nr:esterase-like activity of phytase family protein [Alphaproteobacteria bacterium]
MAALPRLRPVRRFALLASLLLVACGQAAVGGAEGFILRAEPIPLAPERPSETRAGRLEYLAGFVLTSPDERLSGLSAMELSADGSRLTAVSDFGHWLLAELRHDTTGRLAGFAGAAMVPLLGRDGRPLEGKSMADAESIAVDPRGGFLVGFEGQHRVWRYLDPMARPAPVRLPPEIARLPANRGIEAMTMLANGDLFLLSEGVADDNGDSMGWLRRAGAWSRLGVAQHDAYRPTGLATLPSGEVLLLERRFQILTGVRARLSVIRAGDIAAGARIEPERLAELGPGFNVDNFEAVAVRAAPGGGALVYLMSDDNRNPLQRTLFMQFRLAPE